MASAGGPLKIAVFHNLPSGGAKRRLHEMVRRLAARHVVDVYTMSAASESYLDLRGMARRSFSAGLSFSLQAGRWFSPLNPALKLIEIHSIVRASRNLAHEIDGAGYDLVFVNPCMITQTPVLLRYLASPSLYFCDEPARQFYEASFRTDDEKLGSRLKRLAYGPALGIIRRMEPRSLACASIVLVNSCYSRETLFRLFGIDARVLYPGVDTEKFRIWDDVGKERLVMAVGRIARHKAYDFLLRSVALIGGDVRVVIVCDAADPGARGSLEGLAARRGIRLEILEGVSDEKLVRLYNSASVLAHAAILEPLGLAPLEAMACGTPVVGVREGGLRESVLDGETGILTDRDERAFAAALSRLLADDATRRDMGAAARKHVEQNWTWDRSIAQLEDIMKRLARGEIGGPRGVRRD